MLTPARSGYAKPGTAEYKDISDRLMALWNAGFDLKAIKRLLFPDRPCL